MDLNFSALTHIYLFSTFLTYYQGDILTSSHFRSDHQP